MIQETAHIAINRDGGRGRGRGGKKGKWMNVIFLSSWFVVFSSLSRIIFPLNDSYTLNFEQYLRQLSWELSSYEGLY